MDKHDKQSDCENKSINTGTNIAAVTCGKCHRVLKNPRSIERGFGPECWNSVQRNNKNPADESDYDYHIERGADPVLVINDLDRGRKSVTNNMEAILNKIAAEQGVDIRLLCMPVVYRDSEGNYDAVMIADDGSIAFHPLVIKQRVTIEHEAIQAALRIYQKGKSEGETA